MTTEDRVRFWSAMQILAACKVKVSTQETLPSDVQDSLEKFFAGGQDFWQPYETALGPFPKFNVEWGGHNKQVTVVLDIRKAEDLGANLSRIVRNRETQSIASIIVTCLRYAVFDSQPINLAVGDISMTSEGSQDSAKAFETLAFNKAYRLVVKMCEREVPVEYSHAAAQHADDLGYQFQGNPHDACQALIDTRTLLEEFLDEGDEWLLNLRRREGESMRAIGEIKQAVKTLKALLDTAKKHLGDDKTLFIKKSLAIALIYDGREQEGITLLNEVANGFAKLGPENEHNRLDTEKWAAYGQLRCGFLDMAQQGYSAVMTWAQTNNDAILETDARLGLAHIDFQNEKISDALEKYTSTAMWRWDNLGRGHPDTFFSLIMMGICFWKQGKTTEAEDAFGKVIEAGHVGQGRVDEARRMLRGLQEGREPPVWENGVIRLR